jgi:Tfp pilus assembly protein PilF
LAAGGHPLEAKVAYREALRLRPAFPEVLLNLGNLLYNEGRFAVAALCYRCAVTLRPGYAKGWCNLGNALQMLGALRAATGCYQRTLALAPDSVAAHHNLGNACMARRDYQQAERCFRRALAMDGERAEHHNSLGNALFQQKRSEQAEWCYRRALELQPGYAAAHTNLANALTRPDQREEMIGHYARALELDPKSAGAHYNLALAHLREGRYAEGWREHEWRWDFHELKLRRRFAGLPQWRGQGLHGATILLHAEQGLGDTLQFVRYAPLVAERGGVVVLEVQPRLVRLLQGSPGVRRVLARGEPVQEFAWQCPLMSLPLAFDTAVDSIPRNIPYIRAAADDVVEAWRRWPSAGLRVGICWAGNPRYRSDGQRSIPLGALLPLAGVPGVSWFSLQMGPACRQMTPLAAQFPVVDASSACSDLAETAALVMTLDLVISVDTSVAHLAGAMGKPLWLALPHLADWRWMEERATSPWYPSAWLFRQNTSGDWSQPVNRMLEELAKLALRPGQIPPVPQPIVTGCGMGSGPG